MINSKAYITRNGNTGQWNLNVDSNNKKSTHAQTGSGLGFPAGSVDKESTCSSGDAELILQSGRCPGEGNGNPLQYSCLGNPKDRGAWRATVHGVAKSRTQLSDWAFTQDQFFGLLLKTKSRRERSTVTIREEQLRWRLRKDSPVQ